MRGEGLVFVVPWDLHHAGGVNQVVRNLLAEAAAGGFGAPLLLVLDWEAPLAKPRVADDTVRMRLSPPWGRAAPLRHALSFLVNVPRMAYRLSALLREQGVKVVNAHYPVPELMVLGIVKRLGLWRGRLVLSVHGLDIRGARASRGMRRLLWRFLYGSADAVVACSEELRQEVAAFDGRLEGRSVTIPNGVDPRRLAAEVDEGFALPASIAQGGYVVNLATFEWKKGQDVLLRAFKEVAGVNPTVQLVMAGRTGDALAGLRALTVQLGLEERVVFLTDVPHGGALRLLQGAAVFVLPSRAEGLPIALLEAAALGVPVVATPVGGIGSVIRDGENGVLVGVDDAQGLAGAMTRLLGDPQERARLGGELRYTVDQDFTWRAAFERYERVFRGMPASSS